MTPKRAAAKTERVEREQIHDAIDSEPVVREALRLIKAADLDLSGFEKVRRRLPGLAAEAARIDASQRSIRAELTKVTAARDGLEARLAPYRRARIVNEETQRMEKEQIGLERQVANLECRFASGRDRLLTANCALEEERRSGRATLVPLLARLCERHGKEIRPSVDDTNLLLSLAERGRDRLLMVGGDVSGPIDRAWCEVGRIGNHADRLVGGGGERCRQAFLIGGGDVVEVVIDTLAGSVVLRPASWRQRQGPEEVLPTP